MAVPKSIIEKYLPQDKESLMYGVPVPELTREELESLLVFSEIKGSKQSETRRSRRNYNEMSRMWWKGLSYSGRS